MLTDFNDIWWECIYPLFATKYATCEANAKRASLLAFRIQRSSSRCIAWRIFGYDGC